MVSYPPPLQLKLLPPLGGDNILPPTTPLPEAALTNHPSAQARWHPSPPSARPSRRPWAYAAEHNIRSTSTCRNKKGGLVRMRIQASGFTRVPISSYHVVNTITSRYTKVSRPNSGFISPNSCPNTVHYYTTPTALPLPGGFILFFLSSMAMQSSPASNISQTKSIAINK